MRNLTPNQGKLLTIEAQEKIYARFPIRTKVITENDNIHEVIRKYASPYLVGGDMLFISERIIAIMQGRAFPIEHIAPRLLARILSMFVHKSPYGIGLGSPWTMELALREVGAPRILFAAFWAVLTKPFGVRGVFYRVAGGNINAIDGPCDYTLPPFNRYAKLGPKDPSEVAQSLKRNLGVDVVIIDANDLGVAVLGKSSQKISNELCKAIFKDNPLGQSKEQTPLCIVREMNGIVSY